MHLLTATTVALCATLAAGFSSTPFEPGSPNWDYACSELKPNHGFDAKDATNDYVLVATRIGSVVTVKLVASAAAADFKGFIVQANAPGSFESGPLHLVMNCDQGSTIRHVSSADKQLVVATFNPTTDGSVTFSGSVVKEFMDYQLLDDVTV